MACERRIFNDAGPLHLSAVDWSNSSHRSSVAACLVQGAYNLQRDRLHHLHGGGAPDSSWWEFFGFQLTQVLVDQEDQSIFGAIYELKFSPHSCSKQQRPSGAGGNPPTHVIAFRGTLIKQDIRLHVKCIYNTLHNSSRVHVGFQAVQAVVSMAGAKDVWLAGHSLGSAIALLVGRNMVLKMGYHLETYLFNPPFVSLPVHMINNEKIRQGIHFAHTVVKAGMAVAMSTIHNKKIAEDEEAITSLIPWIPYLFINPSDPICAEYLEYFKHRETMVAAGAGEIGRFAARNSVRSMIMSARGKDSEPSHLIPSAYLTINLNHSPDLMAAHKLSQWWRPDLNLDYKLYRFR